VLVWFAVCMESSVSMNVCSDNDLLLLLLMMMMMYCH